jgi:hypothetical protein
MFEGLGKWLGLDGGVSDLAYTPSDYDNQAAQLLNAHANDPQYWAKQVASNPYLSSIFGQGGAMQGAAQDAERLRNTGFSLQPQDYQAYGQASNELARLFGSQESDLANSLANRGFGNAASGTAGAAFTGLQGNKNEQLARAQMGIANARMNFAQNALNSTRQALMGFGQLGNQTAEGYANNAINASNAYNQSYATSNAAKQAESASKLGSQSPTLGQALGAGLGGSMMAIGGAPGQFVEGMVGQLSGGGGKQKQTLGGGGTKMAGDAGSLGASGIA